MLFAVIAIDRENGLTLRLATREAHFAFVRETGVVKLGGPFLDANGQMAGSLILFEAENLAAAKGSTEGRKSFFSFAARMKATIMRKIL